MQFKLLSLIAMGIILITATSCTDSSSTESTKLIPAKDLRKLQTEILKEASPDAQEVDEGQTLEVTYSAWLYDDTKPEGKGDLVDGSQRTGGTYIFELGSDNILRAWNKGLKGMKLGETRRLITPGKLAYGEMGAGRLIPPDAPLIYEITLNKISEPESSESPDKADKSVTE